MYNNLKPIPRHLLAKFLSDPETIKAFEKIVENAGTLIPQDVNEINAAAESAGARAAAVEGMLDVISGAIGLLAIAPVSLPPAAKDEFAPSIAEQVGIEPFALPIPDDETPPYGSMYSNTSHTVVVAAANTAYENATDNSVGFTHLMTFGGNHYLQADRGGIYEINWSMSFSTTSANDKLEGGIMVDGVAVTPGLAHGDISNANFDIEISGSAMLRLSALQQISCYVMNHSAARDITVDHLSLTAKLIDRRVVT